ncbi:hypothetical protein EVAR_56037_1 [Eumeta japonica]|uniref:Uncharacterized protein n=1 Tax=Eumeta variegata TaxID=151549 RepID=A0A4C1YP83_EUMVA|nr:hypothetical protein EVAR_56037_1 [Eumeta japonica]
MTKLRYDEESHGYGEEFVSFFEGQKRSNRIYMQLIETRDDKRQLTDAEAVRDNTNSLAGIKTENVGRCDVTRRLWPGAPGYLRHSVGEIQAGAGAGRGRARRYDECREVVCRQTAGLSPDARISAGCGAAGRRGPPPDSAPVVAP